MTSEDLIRYCDLHCESERALFSGAHINRMLELAGHPEGFVKSVPSDAWISVHEDMKTLCELARDRIKNIGASSIQSACKIIQFPASAG